MGKFTELLKTATKKGLQVEGNYYMDPVDKLELYGEEIVIQGEITTAKSLAEGVADPLKIVLNANKDDNISNYSKFLSRLRDDSMEDPEVTKALYHDIRMIYGDGVKTKTLKVEEIVNNATPEKIRTALNNAFKYDSLKTMTNEDFVLNLMNGVNLANEFRGLSQQLQKVSKKQDKQKILKNMVVHTVMMGRVNKALNQEIRSVGQKLVAVRHGKKITEVDFDSVLRSIVKLDVTTMDELTMDELGYAFTRFNNSELSKVSEQLTPTLWQKLLKGGQQTYDTVMELYYNSLLSAFPTHVVNSLGTVVHMGKDQVDDVVASGIGKVRTTVGKAMGLKTNEFDRITLKQALHSDLATANAWNDALKVFSKIMITGEGSDSVTKFDFKRRKGIRLPGTDGTDNMIDVFNQFNEGKYLEASVNMLGITARISGKALAAEDAFFKFFAKRRFLYQEAMRQADMAMVQNLRKGMSADDAKIAADETIATMMKNPTREFSTQILDQADEQAQKMTFQQELGPIGKQVSRIFRTPGLAFLAPFVKTPLNVGKTVLDNTFNIFNVVGPLSRGQGKEFDKAFAKILTGNGIMQSVIHLTSGMYGDNVKVTGGPHPDYKVRRFMREMNIPTYSIGFKQDDGSYKYYPFSRVDPLSGLLAMGADYNQYKYVMGTDELESLASIMTMSAADYVGEQPFLQGFAEFNKIFMGEHNNKAFGQAAWEWFGGKTAEVVGTTLSGLNPLGLPLGNSIIKYMEEYDIPVVAPASSYYRSIERSESPEREDPTFDYSLSERSKMHTYFKAFHDKRRQLFTKNPQFNDRYQPQKGMFYKDVGASENIMGGYGQVFSPFQVRTVKMDDVEQELTNLALFPSGGKSLGLVWDVKKIDGIELNADQKDRFNEVWSLADGRLRMPGEPGYDKSDDLKGIMRSVIKDPQYKTLSNENKFIELERVYKSRRQNAVKRMTETPLESHELFKEYNKQKEIQRVNKIFDKVDILLEKN